MTIVSRLELPKFRISSFKIERYDVVRMILGLVLLTAAGLKGYQLATEPTLEKGFLTSRWFLILEVEFEIAFGLLLLSGLYRRLTWLAAIVCFSIFSLVTFYKGISGESSCGCFGKVEINPWYTLIFDLSAVITLLVFRPQTLHQPFRIYWRPTIILAVLVLLIGLPSAHVMISYTPTTLNEDGFIEGEGNFVILEPKKWIGKQFPLFKYINISDMLSQGNWIILFYRHNCHKCLQAISKYREMANETVSNGNFMKIAFLELPPYEEIDAEIRASWAPYIKGKLDNRHEWYVATPIIMTLHNGQVSALWEERTPNLEEIFKS